jgi:hypothetical protein
VYRTTPQQKNNPSPHPMGRGKGEGFTFVSQISAHYRKLAVKNSDSFPILA